MPSVNWPGGTDMATTFWKSARAVGLIVLALAATTCGEPPGADEAVFTVQQKLGQYDFTDHRAWSQSPPGGLSASQVPMLVQIGFDDNFRSGLNTTPARGMTWATSFFKNLKNP